MEFFCLSPVRTLTPPFPIRPLVKFYDREIKALRQGLMKLQEPSPDIHVKK